MRFNKNKRYTYYNSYSRSRQKKIRWDRIGIIAGVSILVIGLLVWFNLSRLQLIFKGYSFAQQNDILSLESSEVKEILSHDKLTHIENWIKSSDKVKYYDEYEQYTTLHEDAEVKIVVKVVDDIFDNYAAKLEALGYSEKQIWSVLKTADTTDLKYLIDQKYTFSQIEPYMKVNGCVFTDMEKYIKVYQEKQNYNYAVLITSYPFIVASNEPTKTYTIQNPDNVLTLVKKGFMLPSSYEPKDLIKPEMPIAPDCDNPTMRKEAADALVKMYEAAKKENLLLVVNSAYRSYQKQVETYESFEKRWGGIYAKEHVAIPGCSEHQTGLGVDLTSESVIKKEKLVFGDTPEYKWAIENAHLFGYILRFAEGTAKTTGIVHEPWHFRYVGIDAATKIYENNWTLEDYCLNEGVIPVIKEN